MSQGKINAAKNVEWYTCHIIQTKERHVLTQNCSDSPGDFISKDMQLRTVYT